MHVNIHIPSCGRRIVYISLVNYNSVNFRSAGFYTRQMKNLISVFLDGSEKTEKSTISYLHIGCG